jgi:S-adenosylmethionine hydrolase
MSFIALITDFGTADAYVGEMKGEILSRCPDATLVDVTHDITPGDVEAGAWALSRVWERFPEGTIHLVVVDPEVGGPRLPIAVQVAGRWFVGPDNGLLTHILERRVVQEARRVRPEALVSEVPSSTFHGRDIFAPAAAWLAAGGAPERLGPILDSDALERAGSEMPARVRDCIRGRVVHIDRFGNLVTDIPGAWLAPTALIEVGGEVISGLKASYASVESGALLAVVGSAGTLEISVRDGSAVDRLNVRRGHTVSVRPERD